MRILLTSSASHVPPRGGSTRSNLAWLDALAANGHSCRVVGGALVADTPGATGPWRRSGAETEDQSAGPTAHDIHAVADPVKRAAMLKQQIGEFRPDWVLVSSEDIGQSLLRAAQEAAPGHVVYLAHTPQFYPFRSGQLESGSRGRGTGRRIGCHHRHRPQHRGLYWRAPGPPRRSYPSAHLWQRAFSAIWLGRSADDDQPVRGERHFHLPFASRPISAAPFCSLAGLGHDSGRSPGSIEARCNGSIRCCAITSRSTMLLRRHARPAGSVACGSKRFGLIVVEAMLRGIPAVASDAGGLAEAKLGTRFVIPVRPIERYDAVFDDQGLPRAVLPEQDLALWAEALEALADRDLHAQESSAEQDAASRFVLSIAARPARGILAHARRLARPAAHAGRSAGAPDAGETGLAAPASAGAFDKIGSVRCEFCSRKTPGITRRMAAATNPIVYCWKRLPRAGTGARWSPASASSASARHDQFLSELAARNVRPESCGEGVVTFHRAGVDVHTVTNQPSLRQYFSEQIAACRPDIILASTDDPAQVLLELAPCSAETARVVYLVRATLALPFGPDLRVSQRRENGHAAPRRRCRGRQPVCRGLHPARERHRDCARAHLAPGSRDHVSRSGTSRTNS